MSEHKKCPICGSRPLELRGPRGNTAITCHNDHDYENWDCPLMNVVMEPWEWDRRAEIEEEWMPLQGPYCECGNQGGSVELCATCGRIVR